jgi:PAS domain-containing protein
LGAVRTELGTIDSGLAARVAQAVGRALLLPAILGVLSAVLVAWWFGGVVARDMTRLRRHAIARGRDRPAEGIASPFPEVRFAEAAVDRLAADLAEQAAEARRERDALALQLNSVSEGIVQLDPSGRVAHANPAARRLLGLPRAPRGEALGSLVRNADVRALLGRLAEGESGPFTEVTLEGRRLLVLGQRLPAVEAGASCWEWWTSPRSAASRV